MSGRKEETANMEQTGTQFGGNRSVNSSPRRPAGSPVDAPRQMHDASLEQQIERLNQELTAIRGQLLQAQKMSSVGALASSITHEFNNILTTVINYAKMGLRHKDVATREKAFDKILSAGHRASKITTGMLSYARNQSDRREPTDLVQIVQDVLVLVEKDLQMHRVRLQTDFCDRPHAMLNASQVQQVLLNLIINGRQAMDAGGQMSIAVKTNQQAGMGEISVRDTGNGIPAEKLPKIFDPFFSTKQADEQGQGGTGLGLSLCRDIIEAHKGRIRVESTLGQGTTFTLKFPLADAPATEPTSGLPVHRAG
jgi:signal transduction histidine kinase